MKSYNIILIYALLIGLLMASCNAKEDTISNVSLKKVPQQRVSRITIVIDSAFNAHMSGSNSINSEFPDYGATLMTPPEVISAVINQLLCIEPDIVDRVSEVNCVPIDANYIFPYLEDMVNTYGPQDMRTFINSHTFTIPQTIYYAVNFDYGGYAIFCPDRRVPNGLIYYSSIGMINDESDISLEYSQSAIFDSIGIHNFDDIFERKYFGEMLDSIRAWMSRNNEDDDEFDITFPSSTEIFDKSLYVLTYCTDDNNVIMEPDCSYYCDATHQNYTDEFIHWHQSEPYNIPSFPNLTGSIPLTIAKCLCYAHYDDELLGSFFNSTGYLNNQDMTDLYDHIYNIGLYIESVYSQTKTIGNTELGIQLLKEIFGEDRVSISTFFEWDTNINEIIENLSGGSIVIRVAGYDWQIVDAITLELPYCSTCGCHTVTYFTLDMSKYAFKLSSEDMSKYDTWRCGYYPEHSIGNYYKYIIITL